MFSRCDHTRGMTSLRGLQRINPQALPNCPVGQVAREALTSQSGPESVVRLDPSSQGAIDLRTPNVDAIMMDPNPSASSKHSSSCSRSRSVLGKYDQNGDPRTARQEVSKLFHRISKDCYHSEISTGPRKKLPTARARLIKPISSDRQSGTKPVTLEGGE